MIDGTGRVAALDGPAKPDDVQPSEGGDVTALPATITEIWIWDGANDQSEVLRLPVTLDAEETADYAAIGSHVRELLMGEALDREA